MHLLPSYLLMTCNDRLSNCRNVAIGILLVLFLQIRFVRSSSLEIPVCCPFGNVLVTVGYFRWKKYECRTISNVAHSEYQNDFVKTEMIHGFRIKEVNVSNVPRCILSDAQILTKFTKEIDLTTQRSCLVKLYGSSDIYAISCLHQYDESYHKVSVLRKCCPYNYVYEASQNKCIQKNVPFNYYKVFFDHPVVLNDNQFKCKPNQAIVEYKVRYNDFQFHNGYLKLKDQRFGIDEFCLENVYNEEVDENGEVNFRNSLRFLFRVCNRESICDRIPCIPKCCEDGQVYGRINGTTICLSDSTEVGFHSFDSMDFNGNFTRPSVFGVVIRGMNCKQLRLNFPEYPDDDHSISDIDGSIYIEPLGKRLDNANYCVEKIQKASAGPQKKPYRNWECIHLAEIVFQTRYRCKKRTQQDGSVQQQCTDSDLYTFVCFENAEEDVFTINLYSIGRLISCFFYALTLLVYLSISKLRNLPGKILICMVISLFIAYLCIAVTEMKQPNDGMCFASAFSIYFSLIAAFSWTNVMCFDIWQTFGQGSTDITKGHRRKFLFYSLYGWGLPSLLTTNLICLTKFNILSENLRPKFGEGRCWFQHTLAESQLLFFTGPVGILFIINFVLFTLTLRYCNRVKREISRMQDFNNKKPVQRKRFFIDRALLIMNIKLFIVMGITWSMEFISMFFYDRRYAFVWYLTDSLNVLLGVSIFFIFVFKKRVWKAVLAKLGIASKNFHRNGNATFSDSSSCKSPNLNIHRIRSAVSSSSLLSPESKALSKT